jgi:hypothetical protein
VSGMAGGDELAAAPGAAAAAAASAAAAVSAFLAWIRSPCLRHCVHGASIGGGGGGGADAEPPARAPAAATAAAAGLAVIARRFWESMDRSCCSLELRELILSALRSAPGACLPA